MSLHPSLPHLQAFNLPKGCFGIHSPKTEYELDDKARPANGGRHDRKALHLTKTPCSKGRGRRAAAISRFISRSPCKAIRPSLGCKRQIRRVSRHAACFQPVERGASRASRAAGVETMRPA